ncbi:MAG: zinc-ribbon domain-containing protein [Lachnospiraceae bacterium]|nr:zinc-ribbon domain-containing protein [Lachnospiraceae bacterium]
MKHYKNLISALDAAISKCMTWKLAGSENEFMNARDVFALALSENGENEHLGEGQFYLVSKEGAIGLAVGYEHLTRWFLIPLTGEQRESELQRLFRELQIDAGAIPEAEPEDVQAPYIAPETQTVPQMNQGMPQQGQGRPQMNQGMPQQGQGRPQMNQGMPQQGQGRPQMNQGMPQQGQGRPQINQGMSQPNQTTVRKRICRKCGAEIAANSKFCRNCGTPA